MVVRGAGVTLRCERPIGALKPLVGAGLTTVAIDHLAFQLSRDIAPCIFEH